MNIKKEFFEFVFERQLVWYNRFIKNTKYWTNDETLQKYKFCNVYRELDKGTQYIINQLKNTTDKEIIFQNVVFYRIFNKYNLYEDLDIDLIKEINQKTIQKIITKTNHLKNKGKSIFNDAYLICGNKTKEPKHIFVLNILKEELPLEKVKKIVKEINDCQKPKGALEVIKKITNVGDFLAYEIWTDLTYFNFFNQKWTDNDFVNIGPGAKWGLEIIYDKKLSNKELLEKIKQLHKKETQQKYLDNIRKEGLFWKNICFKKAFSNKPYLSLRNIEHSLCEFRKYYRLKENKGKKRYYKKEKT